jgi:hypothetical protein
MALFHVARESGIPLVGCLYFGIIDRGTNLLQVRPSSSCNLNCPFCSVDAGPLSRTRITDYEAELDYLMDWVREIAHFKGPGVECHIDSPGEPMIYPQIVDLVMELKGLKEVTIVSMQTNGTLLDEEGVKALEEAGLDRINLSMQAISPDLARQLAGVSWYDIGRIEKAARAISESKIDLLVAPVYMPGINEEEIPKLIKFALEVGAGKKWPPMGIQKFERYRLGRSPKRVKVLNWWKFYNQHIKVWEKEFSVKLILTPKDFGIEKRQMLPMAFRQNEKARVEIRGPGWVKGEKLGVGRDRVVSVLDCPVDSGLVNVKIVSAKHNIYVATPI